MLYCSKSGSTGLTGLQSLSKKLGLSPHLSFCIETVITFAPAPNNLITKGLHQSFNYVHHHSKPHFIFGSNDNHHNMRGRSKCSDIKAHDIFGNESDGKMCFHCSSLLRMHTSKPCWMLLWLSLSYQQLTQQQLIVMLCLPKQLNVCRMTYYQQIERMQRMDQKHIKLFW